MAGRGSLHFGVTAISQDFQYNNATTALLHIALLRGVTLANYLRIVCDHLRRHSRDFQHLRHKAIEDVQHGEESCNLEREHEE